MSSPAPSEESQAPIKGPQEQVTFRFCRECSNMLYPKEDKQTTKLMFACRTCQYSEEAQSSCVFRNNMYNTVGETAGVTQDVGSDPTVGDPSSSSRACCTADPSSSSCCTLCGIKIEEEEDEDGDEVGDDVDMMMVMEEGQEEELQKDDETESVDDAYLSETQYGPDGKVLSTSEDTNSGLIKAKEGPRLTLAELSHMAEDDDGDNEEGQEE